jgi:hypothetical protein
VTRGRVFIMPATCGLEHSITAEMARGVRKPRPPVAMSPCKYCGKPCPAYSGYVEPAPPVVCARCVPCTSGTCGFCVVCRRRAV